MKVHLTCTSVHYYNKVNMYVFLRDTESPSATFPRALLIEKVVLRKREIALLEANLWVVGIAKNVI